MTPVGQLRVLGVVRIGVGAAWLAGLATRRRSCGGRLPRVGRIAATALAVRDLAQGALLVSRPEPRSAEVGLVVDALHALSMLPLAALAPRYRVSAATSAGAAAGWAAAAATVLRRPIPASGRPVSR